MNLSHKSFLTAWLVACLCWLLAPLVLPFQPLFFFAPVLIIAFYQKSLAGSLFYAIFCGLCVDILSSDARFGVSVISYSFTTLLLYKQKRHFFSDTFSTLPLMTYFFSLSSTLIQIGLINTFGQHLSLSFNWFLSDLIYLPLFDALYAFCIFILPFYLLGKRPRRGTDYFLEKSGIR